tara:strand:- start:1818 stop:2042 length:225 start_codon:yes stop_codon:yes gene_type:complete
MKTITPFHRLRTNPLLNADSTSRKANVLEALIMQATKEYCNVMKDIGNDDAEANRDYLSHSILNPKQWEQNQLT